MAAEAERIRAEAFEHFKEMDNALYLSEVQAYYLQLGSKPTWRNMGASKERYESRTGIQPGTLDMLVLQTLLWGSRHGRAVNKAIRTNSGEILKADTGSLYPALHRLERKGWISAEWKPSKVGPRVRVYTLTKKGLKQLATERSRWERMTAAIAGIMNPAKQSSES